MELSNLRYFYEAAKIEHITKASENMHVAQPALTKSIKALEDELGVKLFYKAGRRVKLTEYGAFLKEKLEPIIEELDALPLTVEKLVDMAKNTIKLNVLAASTIITDIIIKFKKKNPDVIFKMTQKESEINSDITVVTNNFKPDDIIAVKKRGVIEERILIAVPATSALAEKEEIDLIDLRRADFITLSGSRRFRPLCDAYCEYAGFKPQVVFESDSLIAVKNLISSGVGVAFWPEFSWGKLKNPHIRLLKIRNPDCRREIIVYLADKEISGVREEFYEFLVSELKKR